METSTSDSEELNVPEGSTDCFTQTAELPSKNMVDKSVDNTARTTSTTTQYRYEHFQNPSEYLGTPSSSTSSILKVRAFKKSKVRTKECNTDWSFPPTVHVTFSTSSTATIHPDSECESENEVPSLDQDESFRVSNFDSDSSEDEIPFEEDETIKEFTTVPSSSPILDTKFLVFWSCLLPLFRVCQTCLQDATVTKVFTTGSALVVSLLCKNNHSTEWRSQPRIKQMNAGNVLLAAAVLYSGNTFARIKEMMNIANVKFFSHTTYDRLQRSLLFPTINKVYKSTRDTIIRRITLQNEVNLIGDGRCDSPGYNAKYGTYTLMESDTDEIIDFHVVHVSVAGNSARMEKEGLVTLLDKFKSRNIPIKSLTTDRHIQIKAYMKKDQPEIKHQCDVWHVRKNIKKTRVKSAKKKECEELNCWIKAIINHFWWSCASCNGCVIELKERWLSLLYHIRNKHRWEHQMKFKKCQHPRLTRMQAKETKWLKEGDPSYIALEKIVADKRLLSDLKYLVDFCHTGNLEVYHSLYNKYCPKRLHFGYNGMIARSQLAVLDFNSGVSVEQAKTKLGELRYKQSFSKVTKSWCVKKIASEKSRDYLKDLLDVTVDMKLSGDVYDLPKTKTVPKCIAPVERPCKQEAIANMRTRFKLSE